ncbi:MAG: hypothetical protein AB8D52_03275 [Gammaproteobacteria bacterium]
MLGTAFAVSLAFSPVTNAESNPFSLNDLSTGYQVAEGKCGEGKCGEKKAEAKCGEGKCGEAKKAEGKCGEGKCGAKGVDMQGNVVELGNFTYGGDNMATYSGGKLATGAKDPAVCGTFSSAKCSVGHVK